jgi:hypothetical protein
MVGPKTILKHYRVALTEDGMGGNSSVWTYTQELPGVLSPQTGNKTIIRDGLVVQVSARFFFDLPLLHIVPTENDRLRTIDDLHEFEIMLVTRPMNRKNFLVAELFEMQKPQVNDIEDV